MCSNLRIVKFDFSLVLLPSDSDSSFIHSNFILDTNAVHKKHTIIIKGKDKQTDQIITYKLKRQCFQSLEVNLTVLRAGLASAEIILFGD